MEAVKEQVKLLLDVKIRKRRGAGKDIFIDHPFYDRFMLCPDSNRNIQPLNILESPENLTKARVHKSEFIDEAKDIISIGNILQTGVKRHHAGRNTYPLRMRCIRNRAP